MHVCVSHKMLKFYVKVYMRFLGEHCSGTFCSRYKFEICLDQVLLLSVKMPQGHAFQSLGGAGVKICTHVEMFASTFYPCLPLPGAMYM